MKLVQMKYLLKLSHLLHLTINIFYIFITIPASTSQQDNEQFRQCSRSFNCGNITNLTYPFWGDGMPQHCGLQYFELKCPNNTAEKPLIDISSRNFQVLDIDADNSLMRIVRTDMSNICNYRNLTNSTLDHTFFDYFDASNQMLNLLFNCSFVPTSPWGSFLFGCNGQESANYFVNDEILGNHGEIPTCTVAVKVPVLRTEFFRLIGRPGRLQDAVNEGFYVHYQRYQNDCSECMGSGGICGSGSEGRVFSCLCRNGTSSRSCGNNQDVAADSKKNQMIIIGVCAGVGCIILCILLYIFIYYRRRKKYTPFLSSKDISTELKEPNIKEESYKGFHIFSYEELEKATDNFNESNELGDGGFGIVYYGVLQDRRSVAVKKLYENHSKRVVGQFMNEVEILARLGHQNLVTLYGSTSCDSDQLLLVYEYVANGTVADHLYGEKAKSSALRWITRLKIAVETAGALLYLHACDVIHRDVKSNNILLDNKFCVKVADFGLSRLVPFDASHVSTLPQGTPGYLDPEYHQLCQLTEKSDVYSFGVVLIELISSKPPVDMTRPIQEVSLANFAINTIAQNKLHELVDPNLGYESDQKVKIMINSVGELAFRCLQNGRDMRPTMAEVLDALKRIQREGNVKDDRENGHSDHNGVLLKGDISSSELLNSDSEKWTYTSTTPNVGR